MVHLKMYKYEVACSKSRFLLVTAAVVCTIFIHVFSLLFNKLGWKKKLMKIICCCSALCRLFYAFFDETVASTELSIQCKLC